MDMIQNSRDILNISISIAVLVIAGFSAWLLYYFAMALRQFFLTAKDIRESVKSVGAAAKAMKEKVEYGAGHLMFMGESLKKMADAFKGFQENRAAQKTAKKK